MQPKIQVLSKIVERLNTLTTQTTGRLYGITHNDTLTIITFSIDNDSDDVFNILSFESFLPTNVNPCGLLYTGEIEENVPDPVNNKIILKYSPDIKKIEWFFNNNEGLDKLLNIEIINENQLEEQFAYIRIQLGIPVISESNQMLDTLKKINEHISSGKVAFYFPSKKIYLFNNDKDDNVENAKLKELLNVSKTNDGSIHSINAINANALIQISKQESYNVCEHAPVLHQTKRAFDSIEYTFNIDRLILIDRRPISIELHKALIKSICQYVNVIIELWKSKPSICENCKIPLEWFYFKPQKLGHVLTVPYINGWDDDKMIPCIKQLHTTLALDLTRPYFRRTNSVQFSNDLQNNHLIINPHESIPSIKDGKTSIVYGLYSYHHYMQNDFDDNGWGCAYRSLQTIVSWYRLQGYTNIPIPSHKEIQKCLVDIGDKSSNFIGSKEWIGSTEVGFVLETLLGVNISVLCATNGEEISTFASAIANHFDTQGTPIMIGGGVLAHTILGINYNESTGEVKFLILDPHYTGPDKLSTIINKGWCGWKSKDFWRRDSFYNMCLPQRPICI
ncbi:PREDICTED: ufm1-specific protease 2 [Polistes dominula]|uniref:Ufm1-specific protease 2 n=1 Tax=Polistes dominula TaxID=743375 RepID=A0ABM1I3X6_POLDO|nr:PREDICTED: ufm1-specific protease 2 [Polistes dominula]